MANTKSEIQSSDSTPPMVDVEKSRNSIHLPPLGNKKVSSRAEKLVSFVKENKDKSFCICSHDNPDPDSIASAFGMYWILQFLEVENIVITYCGDISHPQNRAMSNILAIPMVPWNTIQDEYSDNQDDTIFIFVDCASPSQKNMSIRLSPKIVIDHHKTTAPKDAIAINDEVGACATLITDLALRIQREVDGSTYPCFDPEVEGIKELATALAVGIKTDTLEFRSESTTEDDFKAYKMVSRLLSDDKFQRVVNYELPPYIFDFEEIAWKNKNETYTPNLIAGIGFLQGSKGDCIPYLSDKMMRLKGVQTVMIYGIIEDENAIRASVRTTSASLDAADLIAEVFGEGHGGGKHGSGGAKVKFNCFDVAGMNDDNKAQLWNLVSGQVQSRFENVVQK